MSKKDESLLKLTAKAIKYAWRMFWILRAKKRHKKNLSLRVSIRKKTSRTSLSGGLTATSGCSSAIISSAVSAVLDTVLMASKKSEEEMQLEKMEYDRMAALDEAEIHRMLESQDE